MVMQAEDKKIYTPEEYLEFEINSENRHEYINGEIVLMTGGTPNHNQIAGNFYAALNFALKRQPYRVFVTDQRLWIPRKRWTFYEYDDTDEIVSLNSFSFQITLADIYDKVET
jgi:Uma2 family endonuclease